LDYKPKVTVITTAYNREKYIAQAIESVLAQTFTDFELIVVDDCSRDSTVAIAQSYTTDPRVRVIVNDHNLGDYPNRNQAVKYVRGIFFKYHDSDDIMYPYCLEVMVRALESEPRAGFAMSSGRHWPGGPCPMLSTPRMSFQREFLGSGMFGMGPGIGLFRTAVFRELGAFPEAGPHSDFLFWLHACARVNVLLVPADLLWYRVHSEQEPHTPFERAATYVKVWQALTSPNCPLAEIDLAQAKRNWVFVVTKEIISAVLRGHWRLALYSIRASGIPVLEWIRYLRQPCRSAFAGTPLDENGEYLIPEFLFSRVTSNRASDRG
jgi:glycosyltransferase involved in cell wall biosynthesis